MRIKEARKILPGKFYEFVVDVIDRFCNEGGGGVAKRYVLVAYLRQSRRYEEINDG